MTTTAPELALVRALLRRHDRGELLVLADWCEERSMLLAAKALRESADAPVAWGWQVLVGLSALLDREFNSARFMSPFASTWPSVAGVAAFTLWPGVAPDVSARWPGVAHGSPLLAAPPIQVEEQAFGFPNEVIPRGETVVVETSIPMPARVLRLFFHASCTDALSVMRVRFGPYDVLANDDGVPARLLDGHSPSVPELGGYTLNANSPIALMLRNVTTEDVRSRVGGVALVAMT